MLTTVELNDYFERIGLPDGGRRLVEKARREAPIRTVQSGLGNVRTRFPSRKMGRIIEAESRTVEFPAFVRYEHDSGVLEYYPQPVALDLRFEHPITKKVTRVQHIPDVLVLWSDCVCIEEWREERRLAKLAAKYPDRFIRTGNQWRCPPVEDYLHRLGIRYRLRTADEHPHTFVQNLLFLADYFAPGAGEVDAKALEAIRVYLNERGAVTLAELISAGGAPESCSADLAQKAVSASARTLFTADDVYKAIADGLIVYDLDNELLSDTHRARVYRDRSTLEFSRRIEADAHRETPQTLIDRVFSLRPGDHVIYDGTSYRVVLVGTDRVTLASDDGATEVAVSTIEELFRREQVQFVHSEKPSDTPESPNLTSYSPDELARAIERGRILDLATIDRTAVPVSPRTLRRYQKAVRDAGANPVSRNCALIDRIRYRGNRTRKLPKEVLTLIEQTVREHYNQPNSPSKSHVYIKFVEQCHERGLTPCSRKSFNRELKTYASIQKREGRRQAYQKQEIVWYLDAKDPIHGVRPFEYIHIDHTPLPLETIGAASRKRLGTPYLSLSVDAESRAVPGFYVSLQEPSYRSCMMVLRDIVRRHGRLPNTIIVDNGPEFHSAAFQRFCELYGITVRYRPAGQPRHGSVCERLFGTTQSEFINNLAGNTKQRSISRSVTKSVAPERYAEWTLPALHGALEKYFRDIYGMNPHPAHGDPPEKHLITRMAETGLRLSRLVRLDRTFMIETCPPVDRAGTRKVDPQRGIKVHHLWY